MVRKKILALVIHQRTLWLTVVARIVMTHTVVTDVEGPGGTSTPLVSTDHHFINSISGRHKIWTHLCIGKIQEDRIQTTRFL